MQCFNPPPAWEETRGPEGSGGFLGELEIVLDFGTSVVGRETPVRMQGSLPRAIISEVGLRTTWWCSPLSPLQ